MSAVAMMSHGCADGSFKGPTKTTEPLFDGSARKTYVALPFGHAHGQAVVRSSVRDASVSGLLLWGGPTTIIRRVRAIVVDAIERMFCRRSRAEIAFECGEGVAPSLADGNATSSIPRIVRFRRVVTTTQHLMPHPVDPRVALSVRPTTCAEFLSVPTTAGCRLASEEIRGLHDGFGSTDANAPKPPLIGWGRLGIAKHGETTECLAYYFAPRHGAILLLETMQEKT
jgi:hypothetical protein